MRRALLVCAAITFAIACTDNITEPMPDRSPVTGGTASRAPTVAFATTTTEDGLSISTDKDDYQPGDVVHLTGFGWPANELLDVKLDDEPVSHPPHTWTVTTGEDGTFHDSTYEVDYGDIDVKFTLTVTTRSTPVTSLTVQFTDGVTKVTGSPLGLTFTVPWAIYTNSVCTILKTGGGNNSGTASLSPGTTTDNVGNASGSEFQKLSAAATSAEGGTFQHWRREDGTTTPTNPLCVPGVTGSGTPTYTAVYQAANLNINKVHSGDFTKGENGTYTLTVGNTGDAASSGTVTVQDVLPSGLSFVSATGTGWTCTTAGTPTVVTCTSGASIAAGGSAPAISLIVGVESGAAATVTNTATVAGGGEPAGNNGNNSDSDATTIITPPTNGAPVATNDEASTNEEVSAEIDVLANDTDDGPASNLTVVSLTQPAAGTGLVVLSSGDKKVTYTPPADFFGTATFTYKASDGTKQSDAATVTVTVNPVNDAPSFTKGSDQTVFEDAGAQSVVGWATAITAGPTNENTQVLTFEITNNSNTTLFSVAPAISSNGTLSYTPEANANGVATITVRLKDDGGTANGGVDVSASTTFLITITAVNDAPSFTNGGDKTVNEGDPAQSFANWATGINAGPADESSQTLTFTVTNDNNALFTVQPAVSSAGQLTFTPAAGPNGTANVTVTLKDNGGILNGGVDVSPPQYFKITVNNVNPTLTLLSPADYSVWSITGFTTPNFVNATFTDPGSSDTHTCTVDWGNGIQTSGAITEISGATPGACKLTPSTNPYSSTGAGIYTLAVTVNDGIGQDAVSRTLIVFDPSAGFVTGGGWITSPAGACYLLTCTGLTTGKANFGFVSKYITQKDKSTPVLTGNTEFQFQAGDLEFHSENYEWLLVNQAGTNAQYKGNGRINGVTGYKFMLWATDGSYDTFRIRIWREVGGSEEVVYDNMGSGAGGFSTTPIDGGTIVVHTNGKVASK
jgi:uncharacterized repeat protein (TIGR01451 family)